MFPVRYIHAADLHLDAAFRGISREASDSQIAARLRSATFSALERLFALCEKEKPDFLVIAGDIYNEEDHSIKAQMALRDGCERLSASGVRVFLAHGNHDPLSSRLQALRWPDNTIVFGDSVESHIVYRDNAPVAVVHGISHATARESRNLATAFSRLSAEAAPSTAPEAASCFQLGVLHCTLDSMAHADRYAPCTLDDLKSTGLDAWALGHVHERRTLSDSPFVAYPGNIQGLHIHEAGPRGCLLVTATPPSNTEESSEFSCTAAFHALGPVQWETLDITVEGITQIDRMESLVLDAMEKAAARSGVNCETLMLRARLTGRTELDALLRTPEGNADLAERLREIPHGRPLTWLKDLVADTRPWLDMESLYQREDLLGETLRLARGLRQDEDNAPLHELADAALCPLYKNPRARKALGAPDAEALNTLLDDAQRLCIDLMETR